MNILVINAGSSSLKYELFNQKLESLADGSIERIGQKGRIKNHFIAVQNTLQLLLTNGTIKDLKEITAVGHRVVHGGEKYQKPTRITALVEKEIKTLSSLAPLHNPPNLEGIKACKKLLPKAQHVAVFDTSFHQTLPAKAFMYALPYKLYKKDGIRRYGFHGTSHSYISKETIKLLGLLKSHPTGRKKQSKIITCHLGNGSSITAIKNGISIDTSMGFTPLQGVPMGTRSGDIDPAIAIKLAKKLSPEKADELLNKKSGFKGISELSSDMRDLLTTRKTKPQSQLAIDMFTYKVAQYIGAYSVSLQGLDAISFTGGIGENSGYIRSQICQYLTHLGVVLDPAKNRTNKTTISKKQSRIKIYVIPANEEKEIATQTLQLCR